METGKQGSDSISIWYTMWGVDNSDYSLLAADDGHKKRVEGEMLENLGGGLILRRARHEDTEALVAFNTRNHEEEDPGIGEAIGVWTTDLMTGEHPEVDANIWPVD